MKSLVIRKAKSTIWLGLAVASIFAAAASAQSFTGPASKYYLAGNDRIYVVQGSRVVASFPMAYSNYYGEGVLAVSDTIRSRARYRSMPEDLAAGEYTLSGEPTGHTYITPRLPLSAFSVYDGTTDGMYNYFPDHNGGLAEGSGGIYRTDYYWQNPQFVFYPQFFRPPSFEFGSQGVSGIAYDATNNSLWLSSKPSSWIADYSLDGVLLSVFDTGTQGPGEYNAALGVDPADHTLWLITNPTGLLRQYSLDGPTFGHLLQSGTVAGLPIQWVDSGEFQVCPALTITNVSVTPSILWPPNHNTIPINVSGATTGGCGRASCKIVSVSSNEPIDADGDWVITGNLTLNLRAERLGTGTGRLYMIALQCSDSSGNHATNTVTVSVPRDQGR